jgi:hypothetical protein
MDLVIILTMITKRTIISIIIIIMITHKIIIINMRNISLSMGIKIKKEIIFKGINNDQL